MHLVDETALSELTLRDEQRLRRQAGRLRQGDDKGRARFAQQLAEARARIQRRRASVPDITYPPQLPVSARRDDLLAAIGDHQVVVVAGETGSGKTTQLPKLCLELGRGVHGAIAHTQPRRIAARTVAQRIADELDVRLGTAVGYAVRFDDRGSEDTLVRLVTDGLLLAEIRRDPLLRRYDTVIVDEAHERSLNIDFLLGCLHRILPRRPDLKLIITSATIDPERFSAHFGSAPIVEVSGRTHPVEVRYRPPREDEELLDALADTVEALLAERDGDVLAFFSGEREIRDAAELLNGRLGPRVEVLPLYSRLAAADQQKVFGRGGRSRRVVLATNVAETSVTVPGIRFVVDTGLARVSRYSTRLKVQRLPVEPISRASADQRKGRCGRLADGICVRLFSEEDFDARPQFTDPEVLRTNLASVILQMAALGLGDIEAFPFLEPPDRRQVRDGVALLHELGALDPEADEPLTPLGRKLARLPIDPRLARMVLAADTLGCTREVIVIAAALSIQDPRERPTEQRAQADQLHARFTDKSSDFLAYINLWDYLRSLEAELSRSQTRKRCKAEFLHYLRIREWQDLVAQLDDAAREVGLTLDDAPAEMPEIHTALLAGLLSRLGMKNGASREYTGARGAKFAIFPGSALARRGPTWVMVAELVETTRLWGRTAAAVEIRQVEPLAEHLVKRSYGEPRWDRRRAAVVAPERVTLYGLPIVASRTAQYGRIDPAGARELFIRRALVEGDWDQHHAFMRENERRVQEVQALEARARRRDLLASEATRAVFFEARVPEDVASGQDFDRWWRQVRASQPSLLDYPPEMLIEGDVAPADRDRPSLWKQGLLELALSYRFDPGSAADGVTVHIPLQSLGSVRETNFEWLVPAFRQELFISLLRSLPKSLRTPLVPIPDTAAALLGAVKPRSGPLLQVLAEAIERLRGPRIAPNDWSLELLPSHLRMTFSIEDEDGTVLASGQSLAALRDQLRPLLKQRLQLEVPGLTRHGMRGFEIESLPRSVDLTAGLQAYPALVDEGDTVGIRIYETSGEQAAAMARGTRRLLRLTVPSPRQWVVGQLGGPLSLALTAAPHGNLEVTIEDATSAAIDALVASGGGPAWDAEAFEALREHTRGEIRPTTLGAMVALGQILDAVRTVREQLDTLPASAELGPARQDVARQLGRLVYPGMLAAAGLTRLPDVERYLLAAAQRLERLPRQASADRERMAAIHDLEAQSAGRPDVLWLIEELRVAQLAQGPYVRPGATVKRVREALAAGIGAVPG
ncbi:MAG TPA: ATP-dependent RNA helicase HrpA [Solirubrobacteraceae bacterium]|jgi:ATP-dependent helicase HrpA|nr:ATP-dependent RNA helicase HrpA [Solirubrobacteraceae bacterium]